MMPDTFRVIFKMIIKIKLLKIIDVKIRQKFLFVVSTPRVESVELAYSLIYLAVHSQHVNTFVYLLLICPTCGAF